LFALLQGAGPGFGGKAQNIAGVALCPREMEKATVACFAHVEALPTGSSAVLEPDNLPLLVTFDDVTDPKSVKLVDPANLAGTFGSGFALKSITVEITDETVTEGKVESVLGWLKERNPIFLENWKSFPADHPLRNISKFSFKTRE
jgi:hypothetical protein